MQFRKTRKTTICHLKTKKIKTLDIDDAIGFSYIQSHFYFMDRTTQKLSELPIGTRLVYRAKNDWRSAVISKFGEEKATLIVCSPTGRTYRLSRLLDAEIIFVGKIPVLKKDAKDDWRENFTTYDLRW